MITTLHVAVAVLDCFLSFTLLLHVGLRCIFPYAHPVHIYASALASSLGVISDLERILRLWKIRFPNCSWIMDSLACLRQTVATSGSSRCYFYRCMFKS